MTMPPTRVPVTPWRLRRRGRPPRRPVVGVLALGESIAFLHGTASWGPKQHGPDCRQKKIASVVGEVIGILVNHFAVVYLISCIRGAGFWPSCSSVFSWSHGRHRGDDNEAVRLRSS